MIINQILHTLSYGDAISGEVLAMHRSLTELGFTSNIYAINIHEKYKGIAKKINSYRGDESEDYLVMHYSLGSPLNNIYRESRAKKKVCIYHNITPPHWFKGINPRVANDTSAGLSELKSIAELSTLVLADSPFNARELLEMGIESELLELPIDPKRWSGQPNPGIASALRGNGMVNLLHVGRLAPNKCIEDIIKIFYFYHHKINRNSKLWIVGIDIDTELYSLALNRMVDEFILTDAVVFTGGVADEELKAFYAESDIYLCMSEHEGFCLPVLEAMNMGLPVISCNFGALPETVGSGGIVCKEKRFNEIAELVDIITTDGELKQKLVSAGKDRVQELSIGNFKERLREIFA